MTDSTSSTFTVPIDIADLDRARQFGSQYHGAKAEQVYHNTLAVLAVDSFLRGLEIETALAASESQDTVYQVLMDVSDLEISDLGKLECRPVLPQADVVSIPPEVWTERIGYVAVQLDLNLWQEATLLGFTTEVTESGEVPIAQLQAIAELPAHIQQIRQTKLS
ncbi:MAG: hypothetical protein N4J56_006995 [Chroococcidiopsis sp. SAG 2025]|uniref:DUF1822 family protein n=1 Tax=Chroococcidiopsis sp. SAG 2025 TaxID=171389 RepID=UPI0029371F2F|nr:DUF1822 family protein [Chroococcidiopsis sp. SAG 2025]MDV2997290.1 hypothetical protein [Chroococcidiopsis sp. SAG 2025]